MCLGWVEREGLRHLLVQCYRKGASLLTEPGLSLGEDQTGAEPHCRQGQGWVLNADRAGWGRASMKTGLTTGRASLAGLALSRDSLQTEPGAEPEFALGRTYGMSRNSH